MNKKNKKNIVNLINKLLIELQEDPNREGLINTPIRVADSYEFLLKGKYEDPEKIIKKALFKEKYDEMVAIKHIDFYSICEHHLLPFFGKIHIAYIPNGMVVGLSKVPRIIDVFSRRIQIQERMTQQIAQTLGKYLKPKGVAVVAEGTHMCMQMRGVEKQNSITTTSYMTGIFRDNSKTRKEFFNIIGLDKIG